MIYQLQICSLLGLQMLTGNMQPHLNDVGGGLVNLSHVAHLKNPQVARFLNAYNLDDKC